MFEINWLATRDTPFSSSKTTCVMSAISCWVLKSKSTPLNLDSLHFRAHKMLDRYIGFMKFFFTAMLTLIAHNTGEKGFDSEGTLFQRVGIRLKICKMELA